jgi:hypothetical protein
MNQEVPLKAENIHTSKRLMEKDWESTKEKNHALQTDLAQLATIRTGVAILKKQFMHQSVMLHQTKQQLKDAMRKLNEKENSRKYKSHNFTVLGTDSVTRIPPPGNR